jgi:membrane-associated phospholipid phosphatase
MIRPILCLSLVALTSTFAAKPPLPYGLSPWVDGPMALGLYAMKSNSDALLARTRAEHPWSPSLDKSSIPFFDRWAIGNYSPRLSALSSVVAGAELLVPAVLDLTDGWKGNASWGAAAVDGILLEETLVLSGALSSYAKSERVHATPLSYDPSVPESERKIPQNASSFFSNHTASAFATAVYSAYTFQARHPDSPLVPWVWGGSLGVASAVGSMRVMAGKHFPSDVLAGAAAGALCGYLVPRMHMGASWNLGVVAPEGTNTVGPALQHTF